MDHKYADIMGTAILTTAMSTTSNFNDEFRYKHFMIVEYLSLVGDYGYVGSWFSPNRRQGGRRGHASAGARAEGEGGHTRIRVNWWQCHHYSYKTKIPRRTKIRQPMEMR